MKRFCAFLLSIFLLSGCAAQKTDTRAEELQSKYDRMSGCEASVEAAIARGEETAEYTLDIEQSEGTMRVTVREPEALAGISAVVRDDDALSLVFDGMVLDAGSVEPDVNAVNAVSIFLRAAAKGYVTERSIERIGDTADALRLCFKTEHAGGTLFVAAYFDADDVPLYVEIERDGRVLAYLQFTDFSFCDIIPCE